MKIMHIAQMIQGGLASYLNEILPFQRRALGNGTVLVVIPKNEIDFIDIRDPHMFRTFPTNRRSIAGLISFLFNAVRLIHDEKPDIIHLHSTFAGALIRLWFLIVPWRRPKIIYCAHGWAFNMQVSEYLRRTYALFERIFSWTTDAIVCISEYEYEEAKRRRLPKSLLHCIPNGIRDKAVMRGHGAHVFNPATLNLLFVGRQDRQKGYDILIDAMKSLQGLPIMLHVVGEAVVSTEDRNPAYPNVTLHGWKSRDEVEAFLADADALVMPSRWEGFGLIALEAMRQELPVCASAVDALPELVQHGISGFLFPSEDVDALANLLASLDRSSLQKIGPNGRQWYLNNFTADRMNNSLIDLYRRQIST